MEIHRRQKILNHSSLKSPESPAEEMLQDIATAEDSDPFLAQDHVRYVDYLLHFAGSLTAEASGQESPSTPASVADLFCGWFRRRTGISGLRRFVLERLEQCRQLLCTTQTGIEIIEPGVEVDARAVSASQHEWLTQLSAQSVPKDKQPLVELAISLSQLDRFLEVVESSSNDENDPPKPDLAACVGGAISFGLVLGHSAAKMLFREELERDANAQEARARDQYKKSWKAKNPEDAARIISLVLHRVLEDGQTLQAAVAHVGVAEVELPSVATFRRMAEQEIGALLDEIETCSRKKHLSTAEACAQVAEARNNQGYMLTSEVLQKLHEEYCKGNLTGQNRHWTERIFSKEISKEFKEELLQMEMDSLLHSGNTLDAAFVTYREGE